MTKPLNPIARNPLDVLLPKPERNDNGLNDVSQWRWGMVIDDEGNVQLDNDAAPLSDPPATLVPLTNGARVWVQIYQRRAIVHGIAQSSFSSSP